MITKLKLNRKALLKIRDEIVKRLTDMNNKGATQQELIREVFNMLTQVSDSMED